MRILLILLSMLVSLPAQETLIRQVFDTATDTHVEVLALFSEPSPTGFFPVRVKVSNQLKDDRAIRLDFSSSGTYESGLKCDSGFTISAGAGKSVTRDLLVPLCPVGASSYSATWVSVRLSGSLGTAAQSTHSNFTSTQPVVLLSESLFTVNASTLDAALRGKSSGGGRWGSASFSAKFDPKQLPDEWLAFSGYDSVMMTDSDWSSVPPGPRNALLSWLRMGGQLLIYTTGTTTPAALGLPADTGYGTLQIVSVPGDLRLDGPETVGRIFANPNPPHAVSIAQDFIRAWPLQAHFGTKTFRYALFIVVLAIFAILVGPINLFVFAKSGKRHRLFITTPIISVVASLVLVILIIAQDGFGGSGMRRVLMEVRPDDGVHAALVRQEQFCRTGVLTGSAFTLPTLASMSPVPIASSRWARFTNSSRVQGNFSMQPVDGKLSASGDWFQSRSEHGHVISAVVPTRGRIESTDDPDAFVSTFSFPIDTLFLSDGAGQWRRAERIETGKRFTAVAVESELASAEINREAAGFSTRNRRFLREGSARPGHFVAVTNSAPGIETLPRIRWEETHTVITGPVVAP